MLDLTGERERELLDLAGEREMLDLAGGRERDVRSNRRESCSI